MATLSPLRYYFAIFASALFLPLPPFAFNTPLPDTAVRDAYFLGQRNDERTTEFLEGYRHRLPMPQCGLYVSEIELFTPYAEIVDLSRQHTVGYSAQQAEQEYRDRGDVFRLRVRVFFTDTYSQHAYAQEATKKPKRQQDARTQPSGHNSQGITVQLWQKDRLIKPLEIPGVPVFRSYTVGDACYGFDIVLHYDGEDIARDNTLVIVLTPDSQRLVAEFDLTKLR